MSENLKIPKKHFIAVVASYLLMATLGFCPCLSADAQELTIAPVAAEQIKLYPNSISKQCLVAGQHGEQALQVDVSKPGEKAWNVLYHTGKNLVAIRSDNILVAAITARVVGERAETGDIGMYAESAVEGKKGSLGLHIFPTRAWKTYRRTIDSPGNFAADELRLSVHLGAIAQTLQIQDISLQVYPAGTPVSELKLEAIDWDGRQLDAAWRIAAIQRIDAIRKSNLAIKVVDQDGLPVSNANVSIHQKRHAWRFGTFIGGTLLKEGPDADKYREVILQRYNYLTLPAYLAEWGWLSDTDRTNYFRNADWAQAHNLPARGHLLVYPGWTASPSSWFEIPKPELRKHLDDHIPHAIRAFAQRGVSEWDVTNELRFNEKFIEEIGGLEVAAEWFKAARKYDPQGKLYLNETVVLTNAGFTEKEQSTLEQHVHTLEKFGAPIDGIGLQGHFTSEFTAPTRVLEILDRFAALDKVITITEFDMNNDDKEAQGDFIRDFYTACFSHEAVQGIIQWGFWEGDMWQPRAHLFTKDWQETPASKAYRKLVYEDWWTHESETTGDNGSATFRCFKGTHTLTVQHGDYTLNKEIALDKDQTIFVIVP